MNDSVFIGLNRGKAKRTSILMGILAIGSLIVFWWLADVQKFTEPWVFKLIGGVLAGIFVLTGGAAAKKLTEKNAGILIDENGVTDATSSIAIGLIKWADIKEISSDASGMLILNVRKPESYIKNASNSAIKRLLEHNKKMYKTPVVIDTSYVEYTIEEVETQIVEMKKKLKK